MPRWKSDAGVRLQQAALQLFGERGFDRTTVAEIAARAGLTERTFFRYFADKREVLFWGSASLEEFLVDAVAGTPDATAPIDAVGEALAAVAPAFEQRRDAVRQHHALVLLHAELRERELIKLASLAAAITEALRRRGVTEPAASLTGEAGVAVFKIAFGRWIDDTRGADLARHIRQALKEMKAVTAGKVFPRTEASSRRAANAPRPGARRARRRSA